MIKYLLMVFHQSTPQGKEKPVVSVCSIRRAAVLRTPEAYTPVASFVGGYFRESRPTAVSCSLAFRLVQVACLTHQGNRRDHFFAILAIFPQHYRNISTRCRTVYPHMPHRLNTVSGHRTVSS